MPVGALFLAYIRVGTDVMARVSSVPNESVSIIQGIIMLLITASAFLSGTKHKMVIRSVKDEQKKMKEVA